MTLLTLLLVLAWKRLFSLGELWQLDHHLGGGPAAAPGVAGAYSGDDPNLYASDVVHPVAVSGAVLRLLLWIVIDLLCVGADIKRK